MTALGSKTATTGRIVVAAGLLFVAGTTLVPLPGQTAAAAATPLWCLVCGQYGGVDVLNNLLLFMPLGLGLRLIGLRTSSVVLLGALLSLAIELLQLSVITGRDASLSDVMTNSLGSWAGAMTGTHRNKLLFPTVKKASTLMLAGGLSWLGVQTATAMLLRPWAPDEIRGGAWVRAIPGRIPFDGRVTDAVVSGFHVRDELQRIPVLAERLRQGDVRLDVRLLSGSHTAAWSPVFEVLGPGGGSVLSLEAAGRHLAFQPPMRSSRLRLRRPALLLGDALPDHPGVPLRVTAWAGGDTLGARWSGTGGVSEAVQILGPSLGWSLITPVEYAFGPEAAWITTLWLAGWLAVIAYWSGFRRAPPLTTATTLALLLVAGLALVPLVLGYRVSHWAEWLAGATGVAIGYAGHHFAAYLGQRCDSLSIKESC